MVTVQVKNLAATIHGVVWSNGWFVCKSSFNHLHECLERCLEDFPQGVVDGTIDMLRLRRREIISLEGKKFEHLL